jgi:hypothetical protein
MLELCSVFSPLIKLFKCFLIGYLFYNIFLSKCRYGSWISHQMPSTVSLIMPVILEKMDAFCYREYVLTAVGGDANGRGSQNLKF